MISKSERLVSNTMWSGLSFAAQLAVNLVTVPYVVRKIGIPDFGLYGLVVVLLAPLGMANLGFGDASVKFIAEKAGIGDLHGAARFVRTTFTMCLATGLLGAVALMILGPPLTAMAFHLSGAELDKIRLAFPFVALGWLLQQASSAFSGVPRALQKFGEVTTGTLVTSLCNLLFVWLIVSRWPTLEGYTAATAANFLFSFLYWWVRARTLLPGESLVPGFERRVFNQSLGFGAWQVVGQASAMFSNQTERVLLGMFLSPAAVGIYNVAVRLNQAAYSCVLKLAEVLFPFFSSMSQTDSGRKANLLLRSSWILTSLSCCVLAPLVPLAHDLLLLWVGPEVAKQGAPVLSLLAVGAILGSITNGTYYFLLGDGRTQATAWISILTGAATLLTGALVLPVWGLAGAGVSGLVAMIVQMVVVNRIQRRVFGESLDSRSLVAALYSPVAATFAVLVATSLFGWFTARHWVTLMLSYGILFGACAAAILSFNRFFFAGSEHEGDLLRVAAAVAKLTRVRPKCAA